MKSLKQFVKEEIKSLALYLKDQKKEVKTLQKAGDTKASTLQSALHFNRIEMRYKLLAYASIRGKDLSKVETNPREEASQKKILEMVETLKKNHELETSVEVANV